jgi:tryptophan 2,3-dioxygenase
VDACDTCEKVIDAEEDFRLRRFRHMNTVERVVGHEPGTGDRTGVAFLEDAPDHAFFPEPVDAQTSIGGAAAR